MVEQRRRSGIVLLLAAWAGASSCARENPLLTPAALHRRAPPQYRVKFITTAGRFVVGVNRDWSPLGADRFYNLVRHHFYEGAAFFRVRPGFVAQFGISPNPEVSKAWMNAKLQDDPVRITNSRARLSFATDGPHTRTTQVFINLADNSRLDARGFSPFGEVESGMDVVEKLYSGYGEGQPRGSGPDQARIEAEGSLYLRTEYPKLDYILSAKLN